MKAKEWESIQKDMEEGSTNYGEGSPWMERRSLTQEEVDYFEDKPSSKSSDFIEEMSTTFPDMVRLEPREDYDKAIIGVVERINLHVLCYDMAHLLLILQKDMSEDEAQEYFEYNILGSWMGEHTPVFMTNTNYN